MVTDTDKVGESVALRVSERVIDCRVRDTVTLGLPLVDIVTEVVPDPVSVRDGVELCVQE